MRGPPPGFDLPPALPSLSPRSPGDAWTGTTTRCGRHDAGARGRLGEHVVYSADFSRLRRAGVNTSRWTSSNLRPRQLSRLTLRAPRAALSA